DTSTGGRQWGVEPILEALEVAPSTYYSKKSRPPSKRSVSDAALLAVLVAIWVANYSVYGRRKLTEAAHRAGHVVGRDQVARLMRQGNMQGARRQKRRFTTHADPSAPRAPDLLGRDFTATAPNMKWVCDFTYCSTWSGVVYVAFVVDCMSRRIVGWKAARSMSVTLVLHALDMAAWVRRNVDLAGLICHSDAGSQYTSIAHTGRLADIGAAPSIGTVATSYDNALAETMNGLFKTELLRNLAVLESNGGPWKGLTDLEVAICAWVEWFNERRLHGELSYRTPAEVEAAYYDRLPHATAA
ncbi:MAG: IS3 family transposase, partial [Acidimicrobiales bacterium]